MATDIRRMTREELDALNERGRAWRERNKPVQDEPKPEAVTVMQMDLWEEQ